MDDKVAVSFLLPMRQQDLRWKEWTQPPTQRKRCTSVDAMQPRWEQPSSARVLDTAFPWPRICRSRDWRKSLDQKAVPVLANACENVPSEIAEPSLQPMDL